MNGFIVSKTKNGQMWYAHHKLTPYIPILGSLSFRKNEALEYAKRYNGLPNKVNDIEKKKLNNLTA